MEITLLIWSLALTVLLGVGILWVLDLRGQVRRLEGRFDTIFSAGEDDANGGAAVGRLTARFSKLTARTERLAIRAERTDRTLGHAVQGMGLVRYSAFEDTGGDQSFSLALIDGEGDGVIISALYARDATRVYAKPIAHWTSPRSLTGEEEQALVGARQSIIPDQAE